MVPDPHAKISRYFTYQEVLYLRNWGRIATEKDGLTIQVLSNLQCFLKKIDEVREFLDRPIFIKSGFRPKVYNDSVGGSLTSAHLCEETHAAVDFWCDIDGDGEKTGLDCDQIKEILLPKLSEWDLRMEDNGKEARWVHLDNKPPIQGDLFFKDPRIARSLHLLDQP